MDGSRSFGPTPLEQYRAARLNLSAVWASIYTAVALQLALGLLILFAEPSRFSSPMFDAPEFFFSLKVWGVIFVVKSAGVLIASRRSIKWTVRFLHLDGTIILFYATTFLVAAATHPQVPWGQSLLYFFVSAHILGAAQFISPPKRGTT